MDPNACLKLIHDAFVAGDLPKAYEAALDLQDWLDKGGANPVWANFPAGAAYFGGFLAGRPKEVEEFEDTDEMMESCADLEDKFNFLLDN